MIRRLVMFALGFLVGLFIGYATGLRDTQDATRASKILLDNILKTYPRLMP